MTFEEYDRILTRMLAVQQDIQVKQVEISEQQKRNTEAIAALTVKQQENMEAIALLTENISNLNVVSQRHEDRLTRLYGYQQSADGDRITIMQDVNEIKQRLNSIEEKRDAR